MRSYSQKSPDRHNRVYDQLTTWEELVVNAVGEVIEFWGFKRNQGRVWALLYLRNEPMSSKDLQEALELSKGAVSMIARDLEQWDVVYRQHVPDSKAWHYVAKIDFLTMIRKVIKEREMQLVERIRTDLEDAVQLAEEDDADDETVERIRRMDRLADMVVNALRLFLSSARLDVADAEDVL